MDYTFEEKEKIVNEYCKNHTVEECYKHECSLTEICMQGAGMERKKLIELQFVEILRIIEWFRNMK